MTSAAPLRQGGGPLSIPAPPFRFPSSWPTGKSARSSSGSAQGEMLMTPANWCVVSSRAVAARGTLEAVWQYWNHIASAQCGGKHPTQSLNVLTNGWLFTKPLRAASGLQRILPVGGALVSATCCRIGWRHPRKTCLFREHSPVRGPSSGRGRCPAFMASSVRPGRAHTRSDDFLGLLLAASCHKLGPPKIPVELDEPARFIEGRPDCTDDFRYSIFPACLNKRPGFMITVCGPS